jgi:DNA-binding response OmpR family regulator
MKKILIVEDHKDIRKLLRMTLEFEDVEILEAATGDEGWDMACKTMPDVVLLDVMMPGTLNGLEVCRLIKQNPSLRHTRVVMLTARGTAADKALGQSYGVDGYLVKPFSTLQVLEALHAM